MNARSLVFVVVIAALYVLYMWGYANFQKKQAEHNEKHGIVAEEEDKAPAKKAPAPAVPAKLGAAPDGAAAGDKANNEVAEPTGPVRPKHDEKPGEFRSDAEGTIRYTANAQGITSVHLPAYKSSTDTTRDFLLLPKLEGEVANLALRIDLIENEQSSSAELPDLSRENWDFQQANGVLTWRNRIDEAGAAGDSSLEITRELRPVAGKYYFDYHVSVTNTAALMRKVRYSIYAPVGMSFETTRWGGLQILSGTPISNGPVEPVVEDMISLNGKRWDYSNRPAFVGLQDNYFSAIIASLTSEGAPSGLLERVGGPLITDHVKLEELAATEFAGRRLVDLTPEERRELEASAPKTARVSLQTRAFEVEPGATVVHRYVVYLGPRDNEKYSEFPLLNLEGANSFGMALTTALVKLFLGILGFFQGITGSWGIAIVLLTLCVRTCLHPLNRKQQLGMARMQKKMAKIQPMMKEIQEQYKDDRMKQHQELQKLFKQHDYNPAKMMMGCLVILLQFPVWIGLIKTLYYSLDIRQAPFLWITDLSKADHTWDLPMSLPLLGQYLNILPFIYMMLMVLQIKLQPKPADPQAQSMQRMMMIMMMAFGVIFYEFPSGLMVYFITSTLYGIIESRMIKRIIAREEEAAGGDGGGDDGDGGPAAPSGPLYSASKGVQRKKPKKQKKMQI